MMNIIRTIDYIINKLSNKQKKTLLEVTNYFHISLDFFLYSYLFLFNQMYDFYFIISIFLQFLHWLFFKNECVLNYVEKKLINKKYKLGSNISLVPFEKRFYNDFFLKMKFVIILSVLLYIYYRNKHKNIKYLLILTLSIFCYIGIIRYNHSKKLKI